MDNIEKFPLGEATKPKVEHLPAVEKAKLLSDRVRESPAETKAKLIKMRDTHEALRRKHGIDLENPRVKGSLIAIDFLESLAEDPERLEKVLRGRRV